MARQSQTVSSRKNAEPLTHIPSPGNYGSDKENQYATAPPTSGNLNKRRNRQAMAPARQRSTSGRPLPNKRQRLADRTTNGQSSSQSDAYLRQLKYYDPDQSESERRELRKGLRELTRDLHDSRNEFLQLGNHGIRKTIEKANDYFERVKQTSDATIDSRLLVNAAELGYKKAVHLSAGDAATGIDVDEFVSKCIAYMRQGPDGPPASTARSSQRSRPRATGRSQADLDDSDEEQEEILDWGRLGQAAYRYNSRPALCGFLLGPLSVQKRVRQQTQRKARERIDPTQTVQPQDLRNEDLGKQETSNLTAMCNDINELLETTQLERGQGKDRELSRMPEEERTAEVIQEVMDKHGIADNGGVPLYPFCINPQSFGQSVENLFYISFLVRDGMVSMGLDSQGLPTLHSAEPLAPGEAKGRGIQKRQAVFSLDFDDWRDLIEGYGIGESIIPHRDEGEPQNNIHRQGWHG